MGKAEKREGYILGIDQGGTKTAAAVMREDGLIVGCASAGGAYFPAQGIERAMEPVQKAVEEALRQAKIGREDIVSAAAGITGIDWQGDEERIEKALRQNLSVEKVFACNDAVIALYSGTMRSHGVVVCAGTGMNGALIDRSGRQFVYGDYMEEKAQGGSALALRAARKVFDAELGLIGPTALTGLYLERAGVSDVDALLHRYMTEEDFRRELRFLTPRIMMTAREGDEAACALLDEFAGETAAYVEAGMRKMGMKPEEEEIVLAGSVFKGEENPLTERTRLEIQKRLPGAAVVQACFEPVVGACIMGLIKLGLDPSEREGEIRESAAALGLLRN